MVRSCRVPWSEAAGADLDRIAVGGDGGDGGDGASTAVNSPHVTREYQVCLKCHSDYAYGTNPPSPGETGGSTAFNTNGLTQYTNQAIEFQAPLSHKGQVTTTDSGAAAAYSTNNHRSWHPVMDNTGRTAGIRNANANNWLTPWNGAANVGSQTMYCSDCHGSNTAAGTSAPTGGENGNPWGPHGSENDFLLKGTWDQGTGKAIDADYVQLRAKWEPLYEVTQIKGDGETHPLLSTEDEFADYETWDAGNLDLSEAKTKKMLAREYAREALKQGLALEKKFGTNPYKFGMVGSTDTHTALASAEEDNYIGKHTAAEPSPDRWSHPMVKFGGNQYDGYAATSSGYAGVWATDNTRKALFDAMKRKEVYATTGPRMLVRFWGVISF